MCKRLNFPQFLSKKVGGGKGNIVQNFWISQVVLGSLQRCVKDVSRKF